MERCRYGPKIEIRHPEAPWTCPHCGFVHTPADLLRLDSDDCNARVPAKRSQASRRTRIDQLGRTSTLRIGLSLGLASRSKRYNAVVNDLEHLLVGSCSFTAAGWDKSFYPPGLKKSGYLGYYAEQFQSVEVDATFYGVPAEKTVRGWFAQTPDNFVLACKVPQTITHDSCLVNCDIQFREFINVMSLLDHKLGPMLFQFPYFNKKQFPRPDEFFARLRGFLPKLPSGLRFALELRNNDWICTEFLDLLREHHVAFALIDHPWISRPSALMHQADVVTSDFVYVRLLGDRNAIEEVTQTWDKTVIDRSRELAEWSAVVDNLLARDLKVYTYVNNHFAGHSPETIRQFLEMLRERQKKLRHAAE